MMINTMALVEVSDPRPSILMLLALMKNLKKKACLESCKCLFMLIMISKNFFNFGSDKEDQF